MTKAFVGKLLSVAITLVLAACASFPSSNQTAKARNFGGYEYAGKAYAAAPRIQGYFAGYGGDLLDPWLVHTAEGRDIVRIAYADPRRIVTGHQGRRANRWFREFADTNNDRELTDTEIQAGLIKGKLYHYGRFFGFNE